MDVMNLIESLFRWLHVLAGILWIGLLYFFNWVNAPFAGTMDADTKKKVVPELMPRALFWFRMAAALTWLLGVLLLAMVYYHARNIFNDPVSQTWDGAVIAGIILVFIAPFIYDVLAKTALKDPKIAFVLGWILSSAIVLGFKYVCGYSFRGALIHLGAMFGTIMAYNVWFRIWPSQQKIITATKAGDKPDPNLVALAGTRSRHNTYMSVPLVFTMMGQHATWAANDWAMPVIILVGFGLAWWIFKQSQAVKGF